jgi:hypothetical protein
MIFDDKVRVENDPRRQEREFIAQVPYVPNAIQSKCVRIDRAATHHRSATAFAGAA